MLLTELLLLVGSVSSVGVTQQSENFVVHASSTQIAVATVKAAEECRKELAAQWLGGSLPRWSTPCRLTVVVRPDQPNGRTTFAWVNGQVADLRIEVRGQLDDIIHAVLPHEITHAVFATYFGRTLPRWADEGAATLAEGQQQQTRQKKLAVHLISSRKDIALPALMGIDEYPAGQRGMKAVYLQGFSLVDYLVRKKGKREFVRFLRDADKRGWSRALQKSYGLPSVDELERRWRAWALPGQELPPRTRKKRRWV